MKKLRITPPSWVDSILARFLDPGLHESVMGDLHEKFEKRIDRNLSFRWCQFLFIWEALGFLRFFRFPILFPSNTMLYRSYLLVVIRNFTKDKFYVVLNILGLSIGIASVITVFTYTKFERSFDHFHTRADRLYRITTTWMEDGQSVNTAMNHSPIADILNNQVKDVTRVVRILPYSQVFNSFVSSNPDRVWKESAFCFADSGFFKMFDFKSLYGPLEEALTSPFSVVLTREMAQRYFDNPENALHQTITFENEENSFEFTVTGVVENFPANSHMSMDFVASFSSLPQFMPWYDSWYHPPMYVYMETGQPIDPVFISETLNETIRNHQPVHVREEKREYTIQPVTSIRLHSHLDNEWKPNSREEFLGIFGLTGLLILVIASINFMNMATARSTIRAQEVSIRKVFGSKRGQLIWQFLFESLLYCLVAFALALVMAEAFLEYGFIHILGNPLSFIRIATLQTWLVATAFVLVLAVVSGFYPAFYLSGFNPIRVMKGIRRHSSLGIRKSLVTFQFVISCFLIAITVIISIQVKFLSESDLGFDRDHMIAIRLSDRNAQRNFETLKSTLLGSSDVQAVALSSTLPGSEDFQGVSFIPEGQSEITLKSLGVDEDYISTYKLELVDGRNFSRANQADQLGSVILNEEAVRRLGWNAPIGKKLTYSIYFDGAQQRQGQVIGVVKNFHFQSLHKKIEPLVLYINKHPYYSDYLTVKFQGNSVSESIEWLNKAWDTFNPDKPLEYTFLDQHIERLYTSEKRISTIFNILSYVSVFISCLGLLSLSAFMAEQRTREVGIRKVLGASFVEIVLLQFTEFLPLIVLANIIALPAIWLIANDWLNNFAYHIEPGPLLFLAVLLGSVLLVCLTLTYFSVTAASKNPVISLKHE